MRCALTPHPPSPARGEGLSQRVAQQCAYHHRIIATEAARPAAIAALTMRAVRASRR
jgi:hypothetical protein